MKWRGRRGSGNIKDMRGGGAGGLPRRGGTRGGFGGGGGFRLPGGRGGGLGGTLGKVILSEAIRRGTNSMRNRGGRGGTFGRSGTRTPIGTRRGGGLPVGLIVLLVIGFFGLRACGFDPLGGLTGGGPVTTTERSFEPQVPDAFRRDDTRIGARTQDELGQFISVVLADTEEIWNGIFEAEGLNYEEPTLVRFTDVVPTACGTGRAASGPFYCPGDRQIYLDTSFFDVLANRFGAQGDFAQAYVIAHEVGHHIQQLTGVLPEFNRIRRQLSQREENATSVRVELQADCYAGIWAHYQARNGYLEAGDVEEALRAAVSIGDDAIQGPGANPDNFNHGTSEQRRFWLERGFDSGRVDDCDTFNTNV